MAALRLTAPSVTSSQQQASPGTSSHAKALLLDNDQAVLIPGLKVLRTLLGNIVRQPTEPKFRTIKVANKALEKRLWPLAGARDFLVSLGFVGEFWLGC